MPNLGDDEVAVQRTEAEWMEIIEGYEKSGQSVSAYSKTHGIGAKALGKHLGKKPVPRIRHSEEEWSELAAQQQASGQSIYAWCKVSGISETGLRKAVNRLTAQAKDEKAPRWVELEPKKTVAKNAKEQETLQGNESPVIVRQESLVPLKEARWDKIRISSGGIEIEADAGYPIEKLAVLLGRLVKTC